MAIHACRFAALLHGISADPALDESGGLRSDGRRSAQAAADDTPWGYISPTVRAYRDMPAVDPLFELNMCGDLKEDLKKYRQERIQETSKAAEPHLGQSVPIQTTIEPSIENFLALKTTRIDSVISLEAVENWQAGKGPLVYSHGFDDMAA